jgi:KDO2-lipid IV(A) lauroyltransferase
MEIVPLTGGADPLRAMLSALERERMVCLLCDRSFGASGIDVDLLGEPARLPGGPAVLSRISKVPVVVVIPSYHGPLLELGLSDPIEPVAGPDGVRIATQQIAREVTDGIRRYPHDWHMMQKVFVADLESRPG